MIRYKDDGLVSEVKFEGEFELGTNAGLRIKSMGFEQWLSHYNEKQKQLDSLTEKYLQGEHVPGFPPPIQKPQGEKPQ